jgi:hypothetical protein
MQRLGRPDRPGPAPSHQLLDVVGDGGAIRLHLDLGASPALRAAEPMTLLQLGILRFDPAAAAAQAAPGLASGQMGADALGEPAVVRAGEGARSGGAAALRLEGTGPTRLRVRAILDPAQGRTGARAAHAPQGLPRRAAVVIRGRVIDEALPSQGASDPAARERRDAGADLGQLERHVVGLGAVLGVGDHLGHCPTGAADVFLDHPAQELLVADLPRSDFYRRDHPGAPAIDADMDLVVQAGRDLLARHQRGVRIGAADQALVQEPQRRVG